MTDSLSFNTYKMEVKQEDITHRLHSQCFTFEIMKGIAMNFGITLCTQNLITNLMHKFS